MPTYGYQCTQCEHEFSVFQSMKDAALTECPQCHGLIKRLLYPVGIVFKGSGWYINDSRKPEQTADTANAPKTENAAETKPAADTATPKEAKPVAPSGKE